MKYGHICSNQAKHLANNSDQRQVCGIAEPAQQSCPDEMSCKYAKQTGHAKRNKWEPRHKDGGHSLDVHATSLPDNLKVGQKSSDVSIGKIP